MQHQDLAAGRWHQLTIYEQMGNIGSEVSRAFNWKNKGKNDLSQKSLYRALELIDLTRDPKHATGSKLQELCRMREILVDHFLDNEYQSTETIWRKYFDAFALAIK